MNNPSPPDHIPHPKPTRSSLAHWHENLRLMAVLLSIWFVVSYLLGIVFVESLNQFYLGGFPLGFWFAQQGALFIFIVLIFVYAFAMDRIDRRYGVDPSPDSGISQRSSETSE